MLFVDTRWRGDHGIGRFAREVSARLTLPYETLTERGRPSSPLDAVTRARLKLGTNDVIYSPGYNCGPSRATTIVTIHDLIHLDDPAQASAAKRLYYELVVKPVVRRAGLALTVSEAARERIEEWIDDDSVQVRVVGNGSSEAFRPGPPRETSAAPHFLYVGNLRPHKNVPVLMQALALRPEYRLTLVVKDSVEARQLAKKFEVAGQIEVVEHVDDEGLAALYRAATATLFPSKLEGFGFPALESYLCGTPVVYWEGCRSIAGISDGSGVAVESDSDAEAWASAMDNAVNNHSTLMLAPAEQWRTRFGWDAVASSVESALRTAL
ncbi:glycosyltransferase family 4 protein [Microterricola viridarii]|uniref:glycosyltransferase family 4 protein n=1 Tax=Microterricola viridarii TaxID=412690 RepID=UPI00156161E5|nr:glycosyltransferase family 1 protein [Microterricola viridarii]